PRARAGEPIAPRRHGKETTRVGAVRFHAPERAHTDLAGLQLLREVDPITLGREVDDLEPVQPVRFGQQRHRSGRNVEHPELALSARSERPRYEADPIPG